jgi:hypothetical protein
MTNKTPSYRLKANANYERKMAQKTLRFKLVEDADLLAAIDNDIEPFNKVVHELLRKHYNIETLQVTK